MNISSFSYLWTRRVAPVPFDKRGAHMQVHGCIPCVIDLQEVRPRRYSEHGCRHGQERVDHIRHCVAVDFSERRRDSFQQVPPLVIWLPLPSGSYPHAHGVLLVGGHSGGAPNSKDIILLVTAEMVEPFQTRVESLSGGLGVGQCSNRDV